MLFSSFLFYDGGVKRFISLLFFVIAFSLFFTAFSQASFAAETDDCGAKVTPSEITTNSTVLEKITIDLSKLGFPAGNKYIVNVNGTDVGSRYYIQNSPEPKPKGADIFTLPESKIIEVKNIGPLGAYGVNTDINGKTVTFQGESLIVKVYPESEKLSFFHPDFMRGKALCTSSFPIKKVATATDCTIDPYKKQSSNPSSYTACIQNCNPLSDPRDIATCQQQCQSTCQQQCNPLNDPRDTASCNLQCNASLTPNPLQTALANALTSEDEIFIKVNNLQHQQFHEKRCYAFRNGSVITCEDEFRVILKRDNDEGANVGNVGDSPRSYDDLTSGNLSLGKLEPGRYDLEIRNFRIGSITEGNFCKYSLRIVRPGEIGGGIEDMFEKATFLNPFCQPKGDGYTCDTAIGPIDTNFPDLIKKIFAVLLSLSGGIAVLLIIASGYGLITSSGNPEKTQAARERLTSAIVGLVFIIFSFVILEVIGVNILQLPGFGH